jgi:hypothetical protein
LRSGVFLLCPSLADGSRPPGGRSALLVFIPCSSCSCSPFVSIRRDFEFWLDRVSDGPQQRADCPRVPGGQSACSPRTVRGSWCATGGSVCFNGRSAAQAGQSAAMVRTVRGTLPDGPRGPSRTVRQRLHALLLGSIPPFLLSCFRVCFKESFLRLEVDP